MERLPLARRGDPQLSEGSSLQGVVTRDEVEQHHAQRVDVALRRGAGSLEKLGRHVDRGPSDMGPIRRFGQLQRPARAEVHQDNSAALLAHDVLGLDVAVDEALAVDGRHGKAELDSDVRGLLRTVRPLVRDHVVKRRSVDVLHRNADATVVLVRVVDGRDVGRV